MNLELPPPMVELMCWRHKDLRPKSAVDPKRSFRNRLSRNGFRRARKISSADGVIQSPTKRPHSTRRPPTHSASRAICSSVSPPGRWIAAVAARPLVRSVAVTSIRPLAATPHRTCTGEPFGKLAGSPSIQHSPTGMHASAWCASPCRMRTRTRAWLSATVKYVCSRDRGQLRVLLDELVVDSLLRLPCLDAETVGVDADLDDVRRARCRPRRRAPNRSCAGSDAGMDGRAASHDLADGERVVGLAAGEFGEHRGAWPACASSRRP